VIWLDQKNLYNLQSLKKKNYTSAFFFCVYPTSFLSVLISSTSFLKFGGRFLLADLFKKPEKLSKPQKLTYDQVVACGSLVYSSKA